MNTDTTKNGEHNNMAISNRISITIIFFLSLLLMLRQLASTGYFTVIVEDAFIYPSWAWQFIEALKEGNVYPRWLPLDFWGYGSPTFLLYPPLAFYMTAFFNLFTGSVIPAMNLVKFTALFLTGTGTYFLAKEFYPARAALFAAIFSVLLPFNIFSMYLYGSFAGMVSCMWFAPILLFAQRYLQTREIRYLACAGGCYGGLILTHLITAYMFTFVLVAFVAYQALTGKRARDLLVIPALLLAGLALSSAYVLPLVFERKYVNLENFASDINYTYSNFFILPDMTAKIAKWRFWPIYHETMALHVVLFTLFILLCMTRLSGRGPERFTATTVRVNKFFMVIAAFGILMMFGVSSFIWETVPFFRCILFPSRWLHITAFAASFLSASLLLPMSTAGGINKRRAYLPVLLLLAWIVLDVSFMGEALSFSEKGPPPAISVNWVLEHLPKGVAIDKLEKRDDIASRAEFTVPGNESARVVTWESTRKVVDTKTETPAVVRFRTFDFPGWRAFIDGVSAEIQTERDTQAIMVIVPKGEHRLVLQFQDTTVRRCGKLITLLSLIALSLLIAITQVLKLRKWRVQQQ
jgi:uncharacterized membrane protein